MVKRTRTIRVSKEDWEFIRNMSFELPGRRTDADAIKFILRGFRKNVRNAVKSK